MNIRRIYFCLIIQLFIFNQCHKRDLPENISGDYYLHIDNVDVVWDTTTETHSFYEFVLHVIKIKDSEFNYQMDNTTFSVSFTGTIKFNPKTMEYILDTFYENIRTASTGAVNCGYFTALYEKKHHTLSGTLNLTISKQFGIGNWKYQEVRTSFIATKI